MKWLAAVLSVFVVLAAGDARAGQDDATCAFDYVLQGGLITEEFTEVTPELQQGSKFAEVLRNALPNPKRAFVLQDGYLALVGLPSESLLPLQDSVFTIIPVQTRKS